MTEPTVPMPCPACRAQGFIARIGNRRGTCPVCNAFAARVRRAVTHELRARHEQEYAALRQRIEIATYERTMETWRTPPGVLQGDTDGDDERTA